MLRRRRRFFLYFVLGAIGICIIAYLVHPIVLRSVGAYLVVEDTLQPASAIIVLSGRPPLRVLEAARLYNDGWAPKIILTQPLKGAHVYAFESLGIDFMEAHEYEQEALLRSGVPDEAIMVVEEEVENTLAELRTTLLLLSPSPDTVLIIVTSNYHTRRTSEIWNYLTDGRIKGIVRWTRSDTSFEPATWWKSRDSIKYLVNEYMGLINYWLEFPLGMAFFENVPTIFLRLRT